MNKLITAALAGAALLTAPLAASAQGFHGGGGFGGGYGFAGGFGGGFHAGPAISGGFHDVGGRGPALTGRGFADRGVANRGFAGRGFVDRGVYRGGGYGRWAVGAILPSLYWGYGIDPFDYGFEAAPYGTHWVAVDREALLIDDATGAVLQVAPL